MQRPSLKLSGISRRSQGSVNLSAAKSEATGPPTMAPKQASLRRKPRVSGIACLGLLSLGLQLWACSDKPKGQTSDDLLKQLAASKKECKPPPLELFLEPGAKLNINERGQSMPVEVRVLLLRDREAFDQLDFEAIWRGESEALKKDLVKSATLTVFPGKLRIYPLKSARGVAYVALVGIFRRPEGDGWRYVVNVRRQNSQCARKDNLHTVVHARLVKNRIKPATKKRTKTK